MNLTESNFIVFAAKHYNNPLCLSDEEFLDDLSRIRYIKKLFASYKKSGTIKERLVLNHIVVLYNTFETKAMTQMLFFRLDGYWHYLKPFLNFLNYLTDYVDDVNGQTIVIANIPEDDTIKNLLEEI